MLSGVSDVCKVLVGLEMWGIRKEQTGGLSPATAGCLVQGSCLPGAAAAGTDIGDRGNAE